MAVAKFGTWMGQWKNLSEHVALAPNYDVYGETSGGTGNSYLRHTFQVYQEAITHEPDEEPTELKSLLPMRITILVNGSSYRCDDIPKNATVHTSGVYFYVTVPNYARNMPIPKNGSEFTISIIVITNVNNTNGTEQTFTFTQQACGTITNGISGETTLVTGKKYTYAITNPAINTATIKPLFTLGYYTPAAQHRAGYPDYVEVMRGAAAFKLRSWWEQTANGDTDGTVAVGGGDWLTEGIEAPATYSSGGLSYRLRATFCQFYDSPDFVTEVNTPGSIAIGYCFLNLTKVTARPQKDDDLRPVFNGINATFTAGWNIDPYEKYGSLVGGKTACLFTPDVTWQCGEDAGTDHGGGSFTFTAEVHVNGYEQPDRTITGERVRVSPGVYEQRITYDLPVNSERYVTFPITTVSIIFTVTGDVWGMSATYTATYDVISYNPPRLVYFYPARCSPTETATASSFVYDGVRYEPDENGAFVRIDYSVAFATLNNVNDASFKIRKGNTPPYDEEPIPLVNYAAQGFYVYALSPDRSQDTYAVMTDDFSQLMPGCHVETQNFVMDFFYGKWGSTDETIYGIGMGKTAEAFKRLDIRSDWTLKAYDIQLGSSDMGNRMRDIERRLYNLEHRG